MHKTHRDDVARLYKYLGLPSRQYLDFQTEDDFKKRIDKLVARRGESARRDVSGQDELSVNTGKVVAIVSVGHAPSRKFVAALAWVAARRLKGRIPVSVVDLIPVDAQEKENVFLSSNGVKHILIDTSKQSARMEFSKEIAWIKQEIVASHDSSLVFVDVPEQVMHSRVHAIAAADVVLVLLPSTLGSVRAVEEIEVELGEVARVGSKSKVFYLLAEEKNVEPLSDLLQEELLSHKEMFAPVCLSEYSFPSVQDLVLMEGSSSLEYRVLLDICNYILGMLSNESR